MDAFSTKRLQVMVHRTCHRLRWTWLLAALLGGCTHVSRGAQRELWIPAQTQTNISLEGRELWIDVELSGYTRQALEQFSDYEAQYDDPQAP